MSDLRAKEIKRAALNEVLDYISNYKGVLSEPVYPEIVRMVRERERGGEGAIVMLRRERAGAS